MSHPKRFEKILVADDVALAKVGLVLSLLLLSLRLFVSQVFLLVIPLASGIGCALYLVTHARTTGAMAVPTVPGRVGGYLPSAVILGVAALVVLIRTTGGRTWPVYLLTGVIGTAILAQILLLEDERLEPASVLFQIVLAAVVIRLSALYATPGFVGVDIWTHVPVFIDGIVATGSLSAIAGSKYIMAPFYHVVGSIGALVFGGARDGVYLSLGLLVPLSVLFVYVAGKRIVPVRWALFATALFTFADQVIRWGMHIIPTSLGLVFFLVVLYLVTETFFTNGRPWVVALLAVFSLAVVFTHQVSTTILLVLLAVAAFAALVLGGSGEQSRGPSRSALALLGVFVVTLSVTVVSWMNTPWSGGSVFLWRVLGVFSSTVTEQAGFLNLAGGGGGGGGAGTQTLLGELVPFIDVFGFTVLLAATVIGGLVMLNWRTPADVTYTYLLTAAAMFVVVFGFSLFGIRSLLPGRWLAFMYAPMAIIGAIGAHYVFDNASPRVLLAAVVVLAVGYPMTMVVAEKATLDDPAFEDQHTRYAYTESEIAAVGTIGEIRPPAVAEVIQTDHPYHQLYRRVGGYDTEILVVGEDGAESSTAVVYRTYQSEGGAEHHLPGPEPQAGSTRGVAAASVCQPDRNHVYANDHVRLCVPAATSGVSE